MLYIGLDIGSSSVKGSLYDSKSARVIRRVRFPEDDLRIDSPFPGMAEQNPDEWWNGVKQVVLGLTTGIPSGRKVQGIGIIYQMHGLVCVDKEQNVLRPAIIWCDSRAVDYGKDVGAKLGMNFIGERTLNPPANLTAAKLAWVKENEPATYEKIDKILLPGDYIAMKLSGVCQTTVSGLSEMALWDFKENALSDEMMDYFGFSKDIIPEVKENMEVQTLVSRQAALELGIPENTPISFRAGDQVGNAFAVNVNSPGDAVCNAGTSGVLYGLTSQVFGDDQGRYNSLAHIGHNAEMAKIGHLLCINGCGILYSWIKKNIFKDINYQEMDEMAATIKSGSDDLRVIPYGNGAERSLYNRIPGAHISNIDLNRHTPAHLIRATMEGIAFAFRYGMEIFEHHNIQYKHLRVSHANLFLSGQFAQILSDVTELPIDCLQTEGSDGAARGAAVGSGHFGIEEVFESLQPQQTIHPTANSKLFEAYEEWKELLVKLS